jgi:UDP:flavonoid glycosyltransferase YjiC (YdhE family)
MKVLLVTVGSLGDLHPFIAIGRALQASGAAVTLAVPLDHVAKVEAAGLTAKAILPSFSDICLRLGMSEADVAARVLADPDFVLDQVLLPSLADGATALDVVAEGMDVMVGSIFAFSAGIVSEKRALPLVDLVLQPMTMFSVWDPPRAPRFEPMRHAPNGPLGRAWNRLLYRLMRQLLHRRHGPKIDLVRQAHGLGPSRDAPLIDRPTTRVQTLCCYSPALGLPYPDAPPNTHVVGFPWFDSEGGTEEPLDPELSAFLREGEPPIVFSLGSFAWAAAGDFYKQAAAAARHLGRRAVLLTGTGAFSREGDCASIGYAQHSKLFEHCAAIVHHGGIGTTGQALRAGRPQLVVPCFGDQYDNAARVQALGSGLSHSAALFAKGNAPAVLKAILEDAGMRERAEQLGRQVSREDGAAAAARLILSTKIAAKTLSACRSTRGASAAARRSSLQSKRKWPFSEL